MGKAPTFMLIKGTAKQRERANCVHAGLRILEPSRLQTVQRTKPVRKDHKGHHGPPACRNYRKPPDSSSPDKISNKGKNLAGFKKKIYQDFKKIKMRR